MSWSIKCTWTRIQSYKQAAAAWQKAVVFRSAERTAENYLLVPRGLVDRRKKHLTIERTEAEDFVLRLYGHDVVTWHPDNSITISAPRSTISTGKFANHCSPAGMHVSMWNQHLCVYVDKRTYKVEGQDHVPGTRRHLEGGQGHVAMGEVCRQPRACQAGA